MRGKTTLPRQNTEVSRSDPPSFPGLRYRRRRPRRKKLVKQLNLGNLRVKPHATWGISEKGLLCDVRADRNVMTGEVSSPLFNLEDCKATRRKRGNPNAGS